MSRRIQCSSLIGRLGGVDGAHLCGRQPLHRDRGFPTVNREGCGGHIPGCAQVRGVADCEIATQRRLGLKHRIEALSLEFVAHDSTPRVGSDGQQREEPTTRLGSRRGASPVPGERVVERVRRSSWSGIRLARARTGQRPAIHDYIRSGASTPNRPNPLAMTCRVAAHNHSLATFCAVTSSSARGSTRQES